MGKKERKRKYDIDSGSEDRFPTDYNMMSLPSKEKEVFTEEQDRNTEIADDSKRVKKDVNTLSEKFAVTDTIKDSARDSARKITLRENDVQEIEISAHHSGNSAVYRGIEPGTDNSQMVNFLESPDIVSQRTLKKNNMTYKQLKNNAGKIVKLFDNMEKLIAVEKEVPAVKKLGEVYNTLIALTGFGSNNLESKILKTLKILDNNISLLQFIGERNAECYNDESKLLHCFNKGIELSVDMGMYLYECEKELGIDYSAKHFEVEKLKNRFGEQKFSEGLKEMIRKDIERDELQDELLGTKYRSVLNKDNFTNYRKNQAVIRDARKVSKYINHVCEMVMTNYKQANVMTNGLMKSISIQNAMGATEDIHKKIDRGKELVETAEYILTNVNNNNLLQRVYPLTPELPAGYDAQKTMDSLLEEK
ncbi:hypothetical protein HQ545_02240 [Candidatus Woesearchaeota archaeon]|nr:hypothetical protein [Candidatus Woesearchaeota archaeon]